MRIGITIAFLHKEGNVFSFHTQLYMERRKPLAAGDG
jgi:hypothetical protein